MAKPDQRNKHGKQLPSSHNPCKGQWPQSFYSVVYTELSHSAAKSKTAYPEHDDWIIPCLIQRVNNRAPLEQYSKRGDKKAHTVSSKHHPRLCELLVVLVES